MLNCYKACAITFPFVYILTPFTTLIEEDRTRLAALLAVMIMKAFCVIIGFPCSTIMLTNSATSLDILGTLNGFATTFSALGRASGPAMAGAAFTWGVKRGVIAVPWWLLAVIAAVGAIPAWYIEEGQGPSAATSASGSPSDADVDSDETAIEDDNEGEFEPPRSRAIVFGDGSDELNAREHDSVIHDPSGQDDLPLVGSMRSGNGMDFSGMTRQSSLSKSTGTIYGTVKK